MQSGAASAPAVGRGAGRPEARGSGSKKKMLPGQRKLLTHTHTHTHVEPGTSRLRTPAILPPHLHPPLTPLCAEEVTQEVKKIKKKKTWKAGTSAESFQFSRQRQHFGRGCHTAV